MIGGRVGKRRRLDALLLAGAVLAASACGDVLGSGGQLASLVVIPEFGELATFADNADRLRIVLTSVIRNQVEKDTSVAIDPVTGEARADLRITLQTGSEPFTVLLQAIRSSDGAVLFQGTQSLTVDPGSGSGPVSVPVTYAGPTGARVVISPRSTAVTPGQSFTFTAVVYDAANAVVNVPVTFNLVKAGDSTLLGLARVSGVATAAAGASGTVPVVARSADGHTDTARVSIGAVPPAVRITPGFATIGVGATVTLAGNLVDANGTVTGPASATWTSRSPGVASVSTAGVVTGVSAGAAVIVATGASGGSDSVIVRVAGAGSVPVAAIGNDQTFLKPRAGDTVVVAVTVDMTFTSGELLGSYNAVYTWTPGALRYVGVQPGDFGAPTVNDTQVQQGSLRFSAANATGVAGTVVVARLRFVAESGTAAPQLSITELSAAQTFTNLLSSVVVTSGSVTVQP